MNNEIDDYDADDVDYFFAKRIDAIFNKAAIILILIAALFIAFLLFTGCCTTLQNIDGKNITDANLLVLNGYNPVKYTSNMFVKHTHLNGGHYITRITINNNGEYTFYNVYVKYRDENGRLVISGRNQQTRLDNVNHAIDTAEEFISNVELQRKENANFKQ